MYEQTTWGAPRVSFPSHIPVAVVGGGQAGLAMSWCLRRRGIAHVVLERTTVGHEWSDARWDSFCLVTPNWQCQLPGRPYRGDDPDGFMVRDEIVAYVRDYAASFDPPVLEHTPVKQLSHGPDGFVLATPAGTLTADHVVLATGGYHRPVVPGWAGQLPERIAQVHSSRYRNPQQLPPGDVLVVGSGQSGAQIAEDLHLAGRTVHLAVAVLLDGHVVVAHVVQPRHHVASAVEAGDPRRPPHREVHGAACEVQVLGDLRAGLPGADDEHVVRRQLPRVAVPRGVHLRDPFGELTGPSGHDRSVVAAGGEHDMVGGQRAGRRGQDEPVRFVAQLFHRRVLEHRRVERGRVVADVGHDLVAPHEPVRVVAPVRPAR